MLVSAYPLRTDSLFQCEGNDDGGSDAQFSAKGKTKQPDSCSLSLECQGDFWPAHRAQNLPCPRGPGSLPPLPPSSTPLPSGSVSGVVISTKFPLPTHSSGRFKN